MVEHGDLTGVTRNATIFEKAIDSGHDYDQSLSRLGLSLPSRNSLRMSCTSE